MVLGEIKGGEPVPLISEVNRMLGKGRWVSCKYRYALPFNIGETIKVVDGL
jgi:hypothetical protein